MFGALNSLSKYFQKINTMFVALKSLFNFWSKQTKDQISQCLLPENKKYNEVLPGMIIIHICHYLPMNQSRKNRRVCRKWNQPLTSQIAPSILKWRPIFLKDQQMIGCSFRSMVIDPHESCLYILLDYPSQSEFQIWDLEGKFMLRSLASVDGKRFRMMRCNKSLLGFLEIYLTNYGDLLSRLILFHKELGTETRTWALPCTRELDCVDFGMSEHSASILTIDGTIYIYSLRGKLIQQVNVDMADFYRQIIVHQCYFWLMKSATSSIEVYSEDGNFLHEWSLLRGNETNWHNCEIQIAKSQLFAINRILHFIRVFDLDGQFLYDIQYEKEKEENLFFEVAVSVSDSHTRIYMGDHKTKTIRVLENQN